MMDAVNSIAAAWWGWMGPMLLQAGLLILIISGIDRAIRRWAWPQVRYALWLLVLLKLLIPPSWSLPSALIPRISPLAERHLPSGLASPLRSALTRPAAPARSAVAARPDSQPSPARRTESDPIAFGRLSRDDEVIRDQKTGSAWPVYALGIWLLGRAP